MSKKILKRSLALGALMAFVITGSAWAAKVYTGHIEHEQWDNWKGQEIINVFGAGGLQESVILDKDPISYGVECKGCDILPEVHKPYNCNNSDPLNPDTYVFKLNGNTLTVNGGIFVSHDSFKIIGTDDSALRLNGNLGLSGTVNVGTLDIKNGTLWTHGSEMKVTTQSLNIDSSSIGINANGAAGGITIDTKDLTVNGAAGSITSAWGNKINVKTEKVNIANGKEGILACLDSSIDLKADEGTIESNVYAGGYHGGKGVVNLTLGEGVNWTGKIITDVTDFGDKDSSATLDLSGTWNNTGASSLTNATFNAGSVLKINGADFTGNDVYALNGVGKDAVLKVGNDAKIEIADGKLDSVYNVAKDFATNQGANWTLQADNALWYVDWSDLDENANTLQGTIKAKSAQQMVETGVATNENKEILSVIAEAESGQNATADAINELASSSNVTAEDIQKGAAALLQVGEAGGFTGNVVSVSKQVNGSVGARNSFSGPKHGGPRHRGGHGPSVSEEANGSAIWAQYVHGKDKVDGIDMGGVENAYESQFNGVVLGADFKQVGSYASGIAFNYGEGDSHSKKNVVQSDSEFDFWGVSYYGAVKKQDTNFIFDIGYSESDSDVEQKFGGSTITANPEASTWTAGVKVEKLIDKGAVQIVPYAGLRFLTIDTDDYEAKGGASEATYYSTERQDIWLLPIGVSLSQENVYDSGWIVTPKADLSYTWAMGDTDSSMTVNMPNVGSDTLGYTVMDDGSFMATVGLDAQKEDWTFGVAYSYQKGDSTRSDRWYVNARYSF